jgi:hypothetical protein
MLWGHCGLLDHISSLCHKHEALPRITRPIGKITPGIQGQTNFYRDNRGARLKKLPQSEEQNFSSFFDIRPSFV